MDSLFFWISKSIWGLARPDSLLVLLLVAAFLAAVRNRHRAAKWLMGLLTLCVLTIAVLPLATLLGDPLEKRYPARPEVEEIGAIILIGGAEKQKTSFRWGEPSLSGAADRYIAVLELARRNPAAPVYFAGGSGQLFGSDISEASIARDVLTRAGLAPSRLHLEAASRNTAENATNLRKLVAGRYPGKAVLVTSAGHMPRAMATFCAAGWERLVAWPTDYSSGTFRDEIDWEFADNLDDLNGALREWAGLIAYRLTGRTRTLLGADCSGEGTPAPDTNA